jgi:RNA-binding protein YhbY
MQNPCQTTQSTQSILLPLGVSFTRSSIFFWVSTTNAVVGGWMISYEYSQVSSISVIVSFIWLLLFVIRGLLQEAHYRTYLSLIHGAVEQYSTRPTRRTTTTTATIMNHIRKRLLPWTMGVWMVTHTHAFSLSSSNSLSALPTTCCTSRTSQQHHIISHRRFHRTLSVTFARDTDESDSDETNVDPESTLTNETEPPKSPSLDHLERAWRYANKPLLRIGSKGATLTHGNSLRQLLDSHTVVKIKINTRRFDNSLVEAFAQLAQLAHDSGASSALELLQVRETEKTILVGLPGTLARIAAGEFPPPEKKWPPEEQKE